MSTRAAASLATRAPAPSGWVWALLLMLDVIVLASSSHAPYVLAGLCVACILWWMLSAPYRALAFVAFGLPLLDPVSASIGDPVPIGLYFARGLLLAGVALIAWRALWGDAGAARALSATAREPLLFATAATALILAWGVLGSPSPSYGRAKTILFFTVNATFLVVALVYLRGDAQTTTARGVSFLRHVLGWNLAIALVAAANDRLEFEPWSGRLQVLGLGPIWLARQMGFGLVALLGLRAMGAIGKVPALLAALLFGVVFLRTESRGPALAMLVAAAAWIASSDGPLGRRAFVRGALFTGVALVSGILLLFIVAAERFGNLPFAGAAVSNFVRLRILAVAGEQITSVLGTGLGTGGFSALAQAGDRRLYPHNLFLEVGLENGLVGLLALATFLVLIWRRWRRARVEWRPRDLTRWNLTRVAMASALFALVAAQFSGDISGNEGIWLWAGVLAVWSARD